MPKWQSLNLRLYIVGLIVTSSLAQAENGKIAPEEGFSLYTNVKMGKHFKNCFPEELSEDQILKLPAGGRQVSEHEIHITQAGKQIPPLNCNKIVLKYIGTPAFDEMKQYIKNYTEQNVKLAGKKGFIAPKQIIAKLDKSSAGLYSRSAGFGAGQNYYLAAKYAYGTYEFWVRYYLFKLGAPYDKEDEDKQIKELEKFFSPSL